MHITTKNKIGDEIYVLRGEYIFLTEIIKIEITQHDVIYVVEAGNPANPEKIKINEASSFSNIDDFLSDLRGKVTSFKQLQREYNNEY